MDLGAKMKTLRQHAGRVRGMDRPLTQKELAYAIHAETGIPISQGYLSQLENGRRVHLTSRSREHLARFFRVHPGYLVNDPDAAVPHAVLLDSKHAVAQHALARLAVHPRHDHLWTLIDLLVDLPDAELDDMFTRLFHGRATTQEKRP
jgi:transcriptional regulator with XRE-family HTH domain